MQEWTEKLLKLQELDLSISKLSANLAQIPVKIQESEKLFAAEAVALKQALLNLKHAEAECVRLENEENANAAKKRDFQQKASQIKKNDEYKAALEQLAQFDVTRQALEEEHLEWMDKADAARADVKEKEHSFALAKKRAAGVKADLTDLESRCRQQLEEKRGARPELAAAVETSLLRRYEQLRANRNFSPLQPCVVPVISESCGRCRMRVTPQNCQVVLKGEVVFCEQCGAVLYSE
ncbi:MAG: hypothetical protein J6S21_04670 [Victivallales bacterium]|nr:hypothetical protein [Victivallales bacterium]